jgi:RNA polymerase sigma-70 factor (ECF subfamily)
MTMSGPAEARYVAFLETISTLRPALHRYCARMTGSVTDGEDVVQESLFEAYRNLERFDESRPLKPWLFRIAHNRCIDFLRRQGVRDEAEAAAATPEAVSPADPPTLGVSKAVEHLVASLPPKERASVLLKDVFDYSLEEIAELVDTSVGGVKAALNRARTKLAAAPSSSSLASSQPAKTANPELLRIMRLYVDRFNRHDWDGVRELVSADATLTVGDRFTGRFADAQYFFNYNRWPWPWKLAVGALDGEPMVIVLRGDADTWTIYSAIRMNVAGQKVERITDYIHCPWMIQAAEAVSLGGTT